jgi:hypothetical protein
MAIDADNRNHALLRSTLKTKLEAEHKRLSRMKAQESLSPDEAAELSTTC